MGLFSSVFESIRQATTITAQVVTWPVRKTSEFVSSLLEGLHFALPTTLPKSGSLAIPNVEKKDLLPKTVNHCLSRNLSFLAMASYSASYLPGHIATVGNMCAIPAQLQVAILGLAYLWLAFDFTKVFLLNKLYLMNITSFTNRIAPPRGVKKCDCPDEQFSQGIAKDNLYYLTGLSALMLPKLSLGLVSRYATMPAPVNYAVTAVSLLWECLLYGQSLVNLYLQQAEMCSDCRFDWFASHNTFCFAVGLPVMASYYALNQLFTVLGLLRFSNDATTMGYSRTGLSFMADYALFSTIWCIAVLSSQLGAITRKTREEESLTVDFNHYPRKISNVMINGFSTTCWPVIQKFFEPKPPSPTIEALLVWLYWTKPVRVMKHNAIHSPPIQALLIANKEALLEGIKTLGIVHTLEGQSKSTGFVGQAKDAAKAAVRKALKVGGAYDLKLEIERNLHPSIYPPLKKLLRARFFQSGWREVQSTMLKEANLPSLWLLNIDWEGVMKYVQQKFPSPAHLNPSSVPYYTRQRFNANSQRESDDDRVYDSAADNVLNGLLSLKAPETTTGITSHQVTGERPRSHFY